ncbi:MAG: molybdopterin converting factor subunit 1 [Chloroflexi bacterium]|nr:molybdopterin converting factor subunit 1 [Chloroflexota bacterium]
MFASYRDRAGTAQLELDLPDGSTVARMADSLLEAHPAILPGKNPSRLVVAVNQEYQLHDHVLSDGDEVALIPPVSGGCL